MMVVCGDGVVGGTETCDDMNQSAGDGCSATCSLESGYACGGMPSTCVTSCGDGIIVGTEQCDDANMMSSDGCSNLCAREAGFACTGMPSLCTTTCGDGIKAGAEGCDDMNTTASDGCSTTCSVESGYQCPGTPLSMCSVICGDGLVVGAETCDDGNTRNTDGCSATCAVEAGYSCTGTPSTCAPVCGDGTRVGLEQCDDGNTRNADGCSATCTNEPSELEPNDDGSTSPGATGITGNDFDLSATPVAVTNALAQGVILASAGNTFRAARITPAGDEDVFAVRNDTAGWMTIQLDTWNTGAGFGIGVACGTSIDTGLNVRNQLGAIITSNDNRDASDRCAGGVLVVAPGTTLFAQVVEFGDDAVIANYAFEVHFTPIVCGDGTQTSIAEECDDGNLMAGDGCSATCAIEASVEVEPNEDGTPSTGGSGITGNDFDNAGMAANNSLAQGLTSVGALRNWRAALTPAGDEDVFAFNNPTAAAIEIQVDTFDPTVGLNRPCTSIDTGINVRNLAGTIVTSNDSRSGADLCSRVLFSVPPGQTLYVHVTEYGDNATIARYALVSRLQVCGDGVRGLSEQCDDGNNVAGDGCSATCTIEAGFTCSVTASPNICRPAPTTIPSACVVGGFTDVTVADGDDATSATAALPFSLRHVGSTMTHYSISTNGFVVLFTSSSGTLTTSSPTNSIAMPNASTPNGILAPFWDNLVLTTTTGLQRQTLGTAPNRRFVVNWTGTIFNVANSAVNFQLHILESGTFEYHYCAAAGTAPQVTGSAATIGAENLTGTFGHAIGINTANTVTPGTSAFSWNWP